MAAECLVTVRFGYSRDVTRATRFIVVGLLAVALFAVIVIVELAASDEDIRSMNKAVTAAARQAAALATDPVADGAILDAFTAGLSESQLSRVHHLSIYWLDHDADRHLENSYRPARSPCGWSPCSDPAYQRVVSGNSAAFPFCGIDVVGVGAEWTSPGVFWIPGQHRWVDLRIRPPTAPCP